MSGTQMLVEVSREEQLEIENICVNENKTISQYFMELHCSNMAGKEYMNENKILKDKKVSSRKKVKLNN